MPAVIDRDELLAGLLADLAAGRAAPVDQLARQYPDLADELRELWAVAQFADLARGLRLDPPSLAASPDGLHPSPDVPTGSFPSSRTLEAESASPLPRDFGDYQLRAELGRGGMGVVYQAYQRSLNRVVALKMVREAHLSSAGDRARFRAEAEAAARLHHPNIVAVYEVGAAEGQAYFCMEYVAGDTLGKLVAARGPLPPREAARLVALIAHAVQHAHEHGVLHRDLKPSNILLETHQGDGSAGSSALPVPKVTDFGLAKVVDRTETLTRTGAVVGTPSYMAPEQATGRSDITPAADVYSLGAILYELLTGRPPFRAAHPVDTLLMVLEQDPVPPRDLVPGVDRDLELVCLKCLQKPRDLRYASAAGLARDLDSFLAGEPMSVEVGSFGEFVSRLLRETHHAAVLENWGLLWMWHSLMIFLLCLTTQIMAWDGIDSHTAYLTVWSAGLLAWGGIFWRLRRRGGPVMFVERQIAHAWAGSVIASIGLFLIEVVQGQQSLALSPVLPLIAGVLFATKAGTLSGQFYIASIVYFITALAMAAVPEVGQLLFGIVSAVTFFVPGLKYYRQRKRSERDGDGRTLLK